MQILKYQKEASDHQKELDELINMPYENLNYLETEEFIDYHKTLIEQILKSMNIGDREQDSFEVATRDEYNMYFNEKVVHQAIYDQVYSKIKVSHFRKFKNTCQYESQGINFCLQICKERLSVIGLFYLRDDINMLQIPVIQLSRRRQSRSRN